MIYINYIFDLLNKNSFLLDYNTITYNKTELTSDVLLNLYKSMLKPRLIEEKMLILLRQGKVSKWFSGNWSRSYFGRRYFGFK